MYVSKLHRSVLFYLKDIPVLRAKSLTMRMNMIQSWGLIAMVLGMILSPELQARQDNETLFEEAPVAHWLFPPDGSGQEYGVFHFRKTFNLEELPDEFIIHVSADNRYRLFINGESVSTGPQRSDLMHWRYETIDLAPYLKQENVLAAVVWNWGDHKPAAQFSHRTAFLVQGNSPFEADLVNSDRSWRVIENKAYAPDPVEWGQVDGYFVSPPGERVDGSLYPWGWRLADHPDDEWQTPDMNEGWGADIFGLRGNRPTGEGNKWQLVPRTIPQMEESKVRFFTVRRASGIEASSDFLLGTGDLVVPPNTTASVLIDQAHLTNAYPVMEVSKGSESSITLTYAESLKDSNGYKGNRDGIENKTIKGLQDVILPGGGSNRIYQTLWFRTYRYVQLDIETGNEELTIHDFHGIFTGYPFELKASFDSNMDWLENMWEMNWRGARVCAWETYFDTPYYEQLQYIGDTRIQALITLYMSDDDRLVRQAISHFNASRIPEGITASRYPSDLPQYIPTFSLIWTAMVHDYWMHRDDEEFVASFLPGIRSVLGWFEDQIDETGLTGPIDWWPYIDWAQGWELGRPPGAKDGHSMMISLQYAYALQSAAELESALGSQENADRYKKQADTIITTVKESAWDPQKGLFRDALEMDEYSQQTNTMALLVGAVDDKDQAEFMQRVLSDTSITQATYYYGFYVFEALNQSGLADQYIDHLVPWQKMLAMGLTTTPEEPEPTRSDSHAWSAHPNYGLLATVLGIRPAEPGFRSVIIKPQLGELEFATGTIPHEKGLIEVSIKRTGDQGIEAEITLPEGLSGVFEWEGEEVLLNPGVTKISLGD
jgi:hypothetical protein